jgi:hypothetical protein
MMDQPSDKMSPTLASSVLARHSDGGIPKPTKSIFRHGFLNPLPRLLWVRRRKLQVWPLLHPFLTARVLGVLNTGSASGGLPRLEISLGFVTKGLRAFDFVQPYSVS